jgi:A/G-specific adenine glycosylase
VLRYFHFFIIRWKGKFLLERREQKDIWRGLYTPPLLEGKRTNKPLRKQIDQLISHSTGHVQYEIISSSPPQQQLLSHQTITGRFYEVNLLSAPKRKAEQLAWVNQKTMHDYGKPKMVVSILENNGRS